MTGDFDKFVELGMKALNEDLVKAPTPEFVFEEFAAKSVEEEFDSEDFTDEEILEFAQMDEEDLYAFLQEASEGDEGILESLTDLFVDEVFGYDVEELSESVEEARSFSSQLKLNRAKQKFDKEGFGKKTRRISLTGLGKDRTSGKKSIRKPVVKKSSDKIDPTTQVAPKKASEKGKTHRIGGKFATKQNAHADQAASAKSYGTVKSMIDKSTARGKREGRRRARKAKADWQAKRKENSFFNRIKRGYKAFKGESIEAFGFALNESLEGAVTVLVESDESEYTFDIPEFYAEEVMDLFESIDNMDEDLLELVLEYVWMDDTDEIDSLFESYNDIEDILESFENEEDFEEFVESLDDDEFEIFEEAVDDYFENDIFEGSLGFRRGTRLTGRSMKLGHKAYLQRKNGQGDEASQKEADKKAADAKAQSELGFNKRRNKKKALGRSDVTDHPNDYRSRLKALRSKKKKRAGLVARDGDEDQVDEGSLGRKRGERLGKAADKAWDRSEEAYDSAHGPESTQASRDNYRNKFGKAVKKTDRWTNQLFKSISKDQNSRDDAKMTPLARRKAKLAGLKAKRQKKD